MNVEQRMMSVRLHQGIARHSQFGFRGNLIAMDRMDAIGAVLQQIVTQLVVIGLRRALNDSIVAALAHKRVPLVAQRALDVAVLRKDKNARGVLV